MKYNEKYTQAQCDKMHWNYMQRLYRKKVRGYFSTNGNSIGGGGEMTTFGSVCSGIEAVFFARKQYGGTCDALDR